MVADIVFILYLAFVVGYAYLCYGKYNWFYLLDKAGLLPVYYEAISKAYSFIY